jgi:hypothetical protein
MTYGYRGRCYAVLSKSLWSCTRSLTEHEWRALITRALAREEAKLTTYANGRSPKTAKREFIPESVRIESGDAIRLSAFFAVLVSDWNLITSFQCPSEAAAPLETSGDSRLNVNFFRNRIIELF